MIWQFFALLLGSALLGLFLALWRKHLHKQEERRQEEFQNQKNVAAEFFSHIK